MGIIYDEQCGKHLVQLDLRLTVEESVAMLLDTRGITLFKAFEEYENTNAGLEEFLQSLLDDGHEELAKKGVLFYDLLMTGIEKRHLYLHEGKLRAKVLLDWIESLESHSKKDNVDRKILSQKLSDKSKHHRQEKEILDKIIELGLDPLNLPPYSRVTGPRSQVAALLDGKGLFTGSTVFGKAWDRLGKAKRIRYQE